MSFSTATLTGTYLLWNGDPASGTVEIIPNSRVLIDAEGDVILSGRVKVALDETGSFSVTLPATDDATVEPATGRQYTVSAKLKHQTITAVTGIELATDGVVDMADVTSAVETVAALSVWLTEEEYAETVARVAALEAVEPVPGPQGEQGPPGPPDVQTEIFRDEAEAARDEAVTAAASVPTEAELSATYGRRLNLDDLDTPYTILHNGSNDVVPGHTPESYRYAWNGGFRVLDLDVQVLADGTLANIHDGTVDSFTTATGSVSTYTGLDFPALTVDAATQMGASGYPDTRPTLVSEIMREYGDHAAYAIEAKDGTEATVQRIVDLVTSLGLGDNTVVLCVNLGVLAPAVAAGIRTLQVTNAPDVPAIQSAGVTGFVCDRNTSPAIISGGVSAGLMVWVYGVHGHYEHDAMTALGVSGIVSDNPFYSTRTFVQQTADLFERKVWLPGHMLAANSRGQFTGTDGWGFQTPGTRSALMGFLCPITATGYTIEFDLTFDQLASTVSRYAWAHVCAPDDRPYYANDGGRGYANGYEIRFQQQGYVNVLKTTRSPASSVGVSPPGTVAMGSGATAGATHHYRVVVSPTQIVVSRTGAGANASTYTVTDADYRGGYVHFGKFDASEDMRVSFSNVTVT